MKQILPYSVAKRLPKKFFQDTAKSTGVDWEQPVEVIELRKVQDVYSKVDKVLEGRDLTDKQVILVYPTSNLPTVHLGKQRNMYVDKIKLAFNCAWFMRPSEYETSKHVRVIEYMGKAYSAGSMSEIKSDIKTQNKFNKMYLLIINKADKRKYIRTFENDVFHGLERVNPNKVQGNFYRDLKGECQQMVYSVGYITSNKQRYDKWNFADLETCLDKSGYYFNPLTLKTRVEGFKKSKFTKAIGTGTPQATVRHKIQEVLERIEDLSVDYGQQVKLNYVRNFKVFNIKLGQLTRIVHAYEMLNQQLTEQAQDTDRYKYLTHDEFAERIGELTTATQQAVDYTDESKPLMFIGL